MADPGANRRSTLGSLDGVRAVAVGLVLLAHAHHTRGFPAQEATAWMSGLGALGVRIFFVVSGFLITYLLLREERLHGSVSLSRFYLRRALRILPAAWSYILIVAGIGVAVAALPPARDLLAAFTYTMNYDRDPAWILGHMWSLGVEEQFYLLWPLAFVAAKHRRIQVLGVLLVAAPLLRVAVWRWMPAWSIMNGETFPTIMDALATGVLLAVVRDRLHSSTRYRAWLDSRLAAMLPVAVLVLWLLNGQAVMFGWVFGESFLNVAIVLWIDWTVSREHTRTALVLNSAPLVIVGRLSYSIYLWQQPFMARDSPWVFARLPLNLVAIGAAAVASYTLIERPFLRLKDRVGKSVGRHTSGRLTS